MCEKYKSLEAIKRNAKPEIFNICEKIYKRADKKTISVGEFCDNLIRERLANIALYMPNQGYSMGGIITVRFSKLQGVFDNRQEYSKSCKYRATHGRYSVTLTLSQLRNTKVIGGLVTYIYPNQRNAVKKCYWYASTGSKNLFELEKVEGYIYNNFHHRDKNLARQGGEQLKQREKNLKDNDKLFKRFSRMRYSFQDSIDSGNCVAGTKAFAMRLHLNIEKSYRGTYLLKLAKEKSQNSLTYINRMIYYKLSQKTLTA